jgi:ADP-ribose pyrophosphatase YjhB (NUDIX family)
VVTIYCIIIGFDGNELNVLMGRADREATFSLTDGFIGGQENADDAARRIVFEFTGLRGIYIEQLHTFSKVDSATSELHISIAHLVLVNCSDVNVDKKRRMETTWHPLVQLPSLEKEQLEIVRLARRRLQQRTNVYPIISRLLPYRFTMPQLRRLYEAIFQIQLDKRNFYKKMVSLGVLRRQNEKEKSSSRKGSFYYVTIAGTHHVDYSNLSSLYNTF